MATTKFYLDTRNLEAGKTAPLKLAVTQKGKTALIHLNIQLLPAQWDNRAGKVIGHPNKFTLNTYIGKRKQDIDNVILRLTENGEIMGMNVSEIKRRIAEELSPDIPHPKDLFKPRFLTFAQSKKDSTKEIYMHTYNRLLAYSGEGLETLSFEDITKEWLTGLIHSCKGLPRQRMHGTYICATFVPCLTKLLMMGLQPPIRSGGSRYARLLRPRGL